MNPHEETESIDKAIRRYPWLDFEVADYRRETLTITGSIDTSSAHNIEIIFSRVAFLSLPMSWRTDTQKPVLSVAAGNSAVVINQTFQTEHGIHLFQFTPENHNELFRCLIGASAISHRILREPT